MSKVPSTAPFSLPEKLEPGLARVRAYWEGLKRGAADIPFGDDLNITAMPDMAGRLMLIEVFDKPVRFRLGMLGEQIEGRKCDDAVGKFLGEIEVHAPLQYLNSQASATIESRAPTHYRHGGGRHRRAQVAAGWICPDPPSIVGKRPHRNAARGGRTGMTAPLCSGGTTPEP